ncbi:alpha/beta fold hydrolase [Pullulanibacillus sp. KACC 23026]|uniref:alpha/beta fold hydrolase n=1 Tax=Pullulanibacillus sp. KACC 23026 TaxID=3028315 RepID=UPI0023B1688B|nr:alpha/beta fold hydrolase [Pullulanibacillus sp. KACC 23026]WEG10910.1 alpha/beta fold hydrolase [Pullulanibacillus sp. KACC 23026]
MATFVISHGAWDGGWYWKNVAARLHTKGHDVYTPTLTGLGERQHLGTPATDLETHIQDIVNVINFEDLKEVILVGHSYSGAVVTGVGGRIPERISEIIYLDAFVVKSGESIVDQFGNSELIEQWVELANQFGDGWTIPAMLEAGSDPRHTAQPLQTFFQKLNLENFDAWMTMKKSYIKCTKREEKPIYSALEASASLAQSLDWPYYELAAGHNPNDTAPEALTDLLHKLSEA